MNDVKAIPALCDSDDPLHEGAVQWCLTCPYCIWQKIAPAQHARTRHIRTIHPRAREQDWRAVEPYGYRKDGFR